MTSWTAKVVNIVQTTSSVKSFTVDAGENFDFKPGQVSLLDLNFKFNLCKSK
jgi:ferredoxin-NADP reductase